MKELEILTKLQNGEELFPVFFDEDFKTYANLMRLQIEAQSKTIEAMKLIIDRQRQVLTDIRERSK